MFESLKAKMKNLFSKAEKKIDKDKVYKDGPELPGPGPDKKDEPEIEVPKTDTIETPTEPPKTEEPTEVVIQKKSEEPVKEEVKAEEETPNPVKSAATSSAPKTGDTTNAYTYVMILSVTMMAALLIYRKSRA